MGTSSPWSTRFAALMSRIASVSDVIETRASTRAGIRTVGELILELTSTLLSGGVEGAKRVSVDIVAALLEVPRSWPLLHAGSAISADIAQASFKAAAKLSQGAPFSYAVGTACF